MAIAGGRCVTPRCFGWGKEGATHRAQNVPEGGCGFWILDFGFWILDGSFVDPDGVRDCLDFGKSLVQQVAPLGLTS
ncbi:MAG: hypothetical protein ACE10K_06555, partial [Rhodothermales bacterium]